MAQTGPSGARESAPVSARTTELYDVEAVEQPVTPGAATEAEPTVIEPLAPAAEAEPGTWAPVPVPPPTYTLKARAPRRAEPRSEAAGSEQRQTSVEELPFDGHALALDEEFEDLPPVHSAG